MGWLKRIICILVLLVFSSGTGWAVYGFDPTKITPAIIANLLLDHNFIEISSHEECVPFGGYIELQILQEGFDVEWKIISGEGELIDYVDGTVEYRAPIDFSSSPGSTTIGVSLAGGKHIEDEIIIDYGGCADVGIFYQFAGEYLQPGIDPGCDTANEGSEFFEISNDELGDGVNPETPLENSWQREDDVLFNKELAGHDQRGTPGSGGNCALGNFPADLRNTSTLGLAANGDTVNYDVDLEAHAVCSTFSDEQPGCASANTDTLVTAVYEMKIDREIDFLVEANLSCTSKPLEGFPNVIINVYRYDKDQNLVAINPIDFGISIGQSCDTSSTTEVSRNVHFYPPTPFTTHRVVVQFITILNASADPAMDGISEDIAAMHGTVRVSAVRN